MRHPADTAPANAVAPTGGDRPAARSWCPLRSTLATRWCPTLRPAVLHACDLGPVAVQRQAPVAGSSP